MIVHSSIRAATCSIALLMCASPTFGIIVPIDPIETPDCDPLVLPSLVHELGNPPTFPADELIDSISTLTDQAACLPMDNPGVPNALVVMTNLTPTDWIDVHYVGDAEPGAFETFLTNPDGIVNGGLAFRIDTLGINRPLVFESMTPDGIFEAGETWHFIIQDYSHAFGLPPHLFGSVGLVGSGSGGDPLSSGSIIALERVPSPASVALLVISGSILSAGRRRRS